MSVEKTYHYNSRVVKKIRYCNGGGVPDDREGHPALATFRTNGSKEKEAWCCNGVRYLLITYREDGTKEHEEWTDENGNLHRENAPACVVYREDGSIIREVYYENGLLVEGRVAWIEFDSSGRVDTKVYYCDGKVFHIEFFDNGIKSGDLQGEDLRIHLATCEKNNPEQKKYYGYCE